MTQSDVKEPAPPAGVLQVKLLIVHPDAELLAVCLRLSRMQAEWQRLYDLTSEEEKLTTPADFAWQAYSDDIWPRGSFCRDNLTPDVPALLLTHPATTPEGVRAKAAAILALDHAADYCDLRDDSFQLSLSLITDAAGLAL